MLLILFRLLLQLKLAVHQWYHWHLRFSWIVCITSVHVQVTQQHHSPKDHNPQIVSLSPITADGVPGLLTPWYGALFQADSCDHSFYCKRSNSDSRMSKKCVCGEVLTWRYTWLTVHRTSDSHRIIRWHTQLADHVSGITWQCWYSAACCWAPWRGGGQICMTLLNVGDKLISWIMCQFLTVSITHLRQNPELLLDIPSLSITIHQHSKDVRHMYKSYMQKASFQRDSATPQKLLNVRNHYKCGMRCASTSCTHAQHFATSSDDALWGHHF
jgi:hypothetical protein